MSDFLTHFTYADWFSGEDSVLRLGDKITCLYNDGWSQFEGVIVEHPTNRVPVVLYNVDPEDPDNSGDFAGLQEMFMDGWEFVRL